jgi:hypothetical protein
MVFIDGSGQSAFGRIVESLPFEALAYREADLTEGSDLCVVGVGRYRELTVHPVTEFIELTDICGRGL